MRVGLQLTGSVEGVFGLLLALSLAGCALDDAPSVRQGTLSEVGRTGLVVQYRSSEAAGRSVLVVNKASDGTCLELGGLGLTLNGRPAEATFVKGGRYSGNKFELPFVDPGYRCRDAVFNLRESQAGAGDGDAVDASRESDVVEVSDGTRTLRAAFPNVLARTTLVPPPPAELSPGESFRLRILPRAPSRTLTLVMLDAPPTPGGARQLPVPWRAVGPDEYEFTVPAEASPGRMRLVIIRRGDSAGPAAAEFPATQCTAERCSAERDAETVERFITVRAPGRTEAK